MKVPPPKLSHVLSSPIRTRVAPSPTGHVHLGTLRTALHNVLAARASGGTFLLRIDDTDQARNQDVHVSAFRSLLDDMGLAPNLMFRQSDRFDVHRAAAGQLVAAGAARLDAGAVVLSGGCVDVMPSSFLDLAAGQCAVSSQQAALLPGLVLIRADGTPTYLFSSVVDDIDYRIDLIIRGMDHLSNTPKQLALAHLLASVGWHGAKSFIDRVHLAHVGLIMTPGKMGPVKMSKRDVASSVMDQRSSGICDPALRHVALMLGWGHPDPQFDRQYPVMSWDDMVRVFPQGALRPGSALFQAARLAALDRKYRARPGMVT